MHIWVDADACPGPVKEILFKAAQRRKIAVTLVANHPMRIPRCPQLRFMQVAPGFDIADNEIAKQCHAGDLVITSDIPLAAEVIAKGAHALSPRGERFTPENIGSRLNVRDFMDTLRASGIATGGPPPMSVTERRNFANHLDRLIACAHQCDD